VTSFFTGTVRMDFAGLPTTVVFRARLNNDVEDYAVTGYDGEGGVLSGEQVSRSNVSTYTTPEEFVFREETVTVTNPGGISAVDVEMNGFIVVIDNLKLP